MDHPSKQLPLDWVKGMSPKSKEDFEIHIRNASSLIKKLRQIVLDRLKSLENEAINKRNYENPSWSFLQADINGEIRGLQYILQLTDFIN